MGALLFLQARTYTSSSSSKRKSMPRQYCFIVLGSMSSHGVPVAMRKISQQGQGDPLSNTFANPAIPSILFPCYFVFLPPWTKRAPKDGPREQWVRVGKAEVDWVRAWGVLVRGRGLRHISSWLVFCCAICVLSDESLQAFHHRFA